MMLWSVGALAHDNVLANRERISMAAGFGMDYGGLGFQLSARPVRNLDLFAGVGTVAIGPGYNFGGRFRLDFQPDSARLIVPYVGAMYGYNTFFIIADQANWNKIFYGPSFITGVDIYPKKESRIIGHIGFDVPIRSAEARQYYRTMQSQGVDFGIGLTPITLTLGVRIGLLFNEG
jgi:hypothetical protein